LRAFQTALEQRANDERARLLRELAEWSTDPGTFAEPLEDPWVERDDAN
jgi:hypothetical protein